MENNLSKLQQKASDLLPEADRLMLHKEKRSDQEGTIEVTREEIVDNPDKAKEVAMEMYQRAEKRDKIFIRQKENCWVIKHQTRHYINK